MTDLGAATADTGLRYTVYPGELSSTSAGMEPTPAGCAQLSRWPAITWWIASVCPGEIILAAGWPSVHRLRPPQLIASSEGTLALGHRGDRQKLHPRLDHNASVLARSLTKSWRRCPDLASDAADILGTLTTLPMAAHLHSRTWSRYSGPDPRQLRSLSPCGLRTASPTDCSRTFRRWVKCSWVGGGRRCSEGGSARKLIPEPARKTFWAASAPTTSSTPSSHARRCPKFPEHRARSGGGSGRVPRSVCRHRQQHAWPSRGIRRKEAHDRMLSHGIGWRDLWRTSAGPKPAISSSWKTRSRSGLMRRISRASVGGHRRALSETPEHRTSRRTKARGHRPVTGLVSSATSSWTARSPVVKPFPSVRSVDASVTVIHPAFTRCYPP